MDDGFVERRAAVVYCLGRRMMRGLRDGLAALPSVQQGGALSALEGQMTSFDCSICHSEGIGWLLAWRCTAVDGLALICKSFAADS